MIFRDDTIAAVATPPGEGGIAIVRVSGAGALSIATRIFRQHNSKVPLERYGGYTIHYGRFVDPISGEGVDDGLLTTFRTPHSYTGEDTVELSCHGGRATTARVLQLTLDAGARLAEPGEFTQRAFLNGRIDLAQAEAVADVIRARTQEARRLARRQLDGLLSKTVLRLKDELIGILAAIEVTIDFSEEVGELDHATILPRIALVQAEVERLLLSAERGRILREGLRVAIAGRPNVGKSSLLNALLRHDRAIVTPIAGTTRDLLEEPANIEGVPVVFVDTAGMRDTDDPVERIGVERARNAVTQADVVLFVLDASLPLTDEDRDIARRLADSAEVRILVVQNKIDLANVAEGSVQENSDTLLAQLPPLSHAHTQIVPVSAATGEGIERLERLLIRRDSPDEAETDAGESISNGVVVANARHQQALSAALASLIEAVNTTEAGLPGDFIAIDVRGALDQLGQITGETVTEEIIHRIFRDFCVGK